MNNTFGKAEKLKSRKLIAEIFSNGKSVTAFPLKMIYLEQVDGDINQAAFSVPKKNFKKAVSRNRIKRQIREAYRNHKTLVKSNNDKAFAFVFLYIGKEQESYEAIENAMIKLLQKL